MNQRKKQRGSITLETAIVLPIFFFMFMALIGLFRVVVAQNQMTHVLVQATKSMSLDPYLADSAGADSLANVVLKLSSSSHGDYFASNDKWYAGGDANATAKKRFIGYLTGGDVAAAQDKLEGIGIVNGLNGVTFGTNVSGENLTVTISYEIQYWFDMFGMGKIPMKQTMYSRLWQTQK